MFHLTPLAIALQGIGYGTLLMSLQGLVAVTAAAGAGGGGRRAFPIDLRQPYEEPPPRRVYPRSIASDESFGVPRLKLIGRSRERRRAEELSLLGVL